MSKYPIRGEFKKYGCSIITFHPLALRVMEPCMDLMWAMVRIPKSIKQERFFIRGEENEPLRIEIFTPKAIDKKAPALIYCHGGAFVLKASPNHKRLLCEYAKQARCKVIFIDYRLAGKHAFPASLLDCMAAYRWTVNHADRLGIDTTRIAIGGDSAGGALASGVCLIAAKEGFVKPCYQMLIYPVTTCKQMTNSMKKYRDTPVWNARHNQKMWEIYLGKENNELDEEASPLEAKGLSQMPPTYIETAEFDCLHDEGVLFAKRLKEAGIEVRLFQTKGTMHGFDLVYRTKYVRSCIRRRCSILRNQFYVTGK